MLSTTAEYALRMMVLLAAQGQRSTTCAALSASGHIPQQYASKVLNMLRQAGLVKGQRGRYGGFVLACDPTEGHASGKAKGERWPVPAPDTLLPPGPLPPIRSCEDAMMKMPNLSSRMSELTAAVLRPLIANLPERVVKYNER